LSNAYSTFLLSQATFIVPSSIPELRTLHCNLLEIIPRPQAGVNVMYQNVDTGTEAKHKASVSPIQHQITSCQKHLAWCRHRRGHCQRWRVEARGTMKQLTSVPRVVLSDLSFAPELPNFQLPRTSNSKKDPGSTIRLDLITTSSYAPSMHHRLGEKRFAGLSSQSGRYLGRLSFRTPYTHAGVARGGCCSKI